MAYAHPDAVVGLHLNMLPLRRDPGWPEHPSEEESAYLRELGEWLHEETGYSLLQGTRPQTPAYALTDSPIGLAAWIVEKFARWSDSDGDPERRFSKDDLITTVMMYWATGAIGSSFWPYYTRHHGEWIVNDLIPEGRRIETPMCYIQFPREIIRPHARWRSNSSISGAGQLRRLGAIFRHSRNPIFCRRASSVSSPNCGKSGMPKPTALRRRTLGFEAPGRPAAVVEVNREATAGGFTLRLERVTDSPGQLEAVRCLVANSLAFFTASSFGAPGENETS